MPSPSVSPALTAEILSIRQQLQAALARCDRLLAGNLSTQPAGDYQALQLRYRISPGGALSAAGVTEIRRRFEAGETNSLIAREMGITIQGVAKRRADFTAMRALGARRPGALRGRITMAADFDDLSAEDQAAMEGDHE